MATKLILRYFPTTLLISALVVITYLALTPRSYPVMAHLWDKGNHWAAFVVLALLIDFSWPRAGFGYEKWSALLMFGLLLEVFQFYIPNRVFSPADLVADAVGILCYTLAGRWCEVWKQRYRSCCR